MTHPSPPAPLSVAIAQPSAAPGDLGANLATANGLVRDAARRGAKLVAFPELFLTGYEPALVARAPELWVPAGGDPRLAPIREACSAGNLTAILGAAVLGEAGERWIAALVLGPDGSLRLSKKENLCGEEETSLFTVGPALPPFDVAGWKVAIGICFDVSRPAHAEQAAAAGADLYVASSFYWEGEERRSDLHLGARAMDNRIWTALANYAGVTGGRPSCGRSGVWAPSGDAVERAPDNQPALLVVELDPAPLARYRAASVVRKPSTSPGDE